MQFFYFAPDLICCLRQITSPLSASCYTHRDNIYQYVQLCPTPFKNRIKDLGRSIELCDRGLYLPSCPWQDEGHSSCWFLSFAERHPSKWAMRWDPVVPAPQRGRGTWARLVSFWTRGFMGLLLQVQIGWIYLAAVCLQQFHLQTCSRVAPLITCAASPP